MTTERMVDPRSDAQHRTGGRALEFPLAAASLCAVVKIMNGLSERCRLVRAYSDLIRLDNRTLQELGTRPGEIDRVLCGLPPRRHQECDKARTLR